MPLKTYPEDPDAWSETTSPLEGYWQTEFCSRCGVRLSTKRVEGDYSVESYLEEPRFSNVCKFSLYDGREFNATLQNSRLNFYLSIDSCFSDIGHAIVLFDKWGKAARWYFSCPNDAGFHEFSIPLGLGTGWSEDTGFDWRFLKSIRFVISGPGYGVQGSVWIDKIYFQYYELVRPELTIDSVPQGKAFTINGTSSLTPDTFGLDPNVEYTVSIDPINFDHWENDSKNPVRTISLAEGEKKTITAYYVEVPPPPPGKGTILCYAYLNAEQVSVDVTVDGMGPYATPFRIDVDPGNYTLVAAYRGKTQSQAVYVEEGEIKQVVFYFKKSLISWIPLAVVLTSCALLTFGLIYHVRKR